MSLFLSKFLPLFIYPVGVVLILLILSITLRKKSRLQKGFMISALVTLFLAGNRWISTSLVKSLEWRYLPAERMTEAGAIVVLGGGTRAANYPRTGVEIGEAGDRVVYATRLYREGLAEYVLLSGGNLDWVSNLTTPAEDMAELIVFFGVPESAIILETESRNTYENAIHSAEILESMDIDRVYLVTSAIHMPRAVLLFEAQGIQILPAPTDFLVTRSDAESDAGDSLFTIILHFVPDAESLSLTTRAIKEYLGILVSKVRGLY